MKQFRILTFIFCLALFGVNACDQENDNGGDDGILFQLSSVKVGSISLSQDDTTTGLPVDQPLVVRFATEIDTNTVRSNVNISDESGNTVAYTLAYLDQNKTISMLPNQDLLLNELYTLSIGEIENVKGGTFPGVVFQFRTKQGTLELLSITVDGEDMTIDSRIKNISPQFKVTANFSHSLSTDNLSSGVTLTGDGTTSINITLQNDNKTLVMEPTQSVHYISKYTLSLSDNITTDNGRVFQGFTNSFYTQLDSTYKFPEISDEELLTKIQEQTFKYFWDFAHPESGLTRERNTSGETVTIGGSGFGVMAILVGIEREFITRQQGVDRLEKIVNFLLNADRFHGVWPHWMNGTTGEVIPFSPDDDGGDLVETAFMIQGLLTVRQYLDNNDTQEASIIADITRLWEEVEWDWYTQGGQDVLYWHWSPNFGWQKNHKIQGWNEALIVYVLAASSPTHSISADVYHKGWAKDGGMVNGKSFYDITLPLGKDRGGPLFFAHYSFLGLDPGNLEDQYADYWQQNVNHTLINRAYCIQNPLDYVGYSSESWGLTASDGNEGYSAHAPDNDKGVITPTAAISSIPYTPQKSMEAIKHFYYLLGDELWGEYGFYDAFNYTEEWTAGSFLAIDQGPIIIMIENHRTALLWDLLMADPEVTNGLEKLGFTSY